MDSPSTSALFGPNADVEFEEDCRRCDAQLCCRCQLPALPLTNALHSAGPALQLRLCCRCQHPALPPCTAAALPPLPMPCTARCCAAASNALHCPLLRCRCQSPALLLSSCAAAANALRCCCQRPCTTQALHCSCGCAAAANALHCPRCLLCCAQIFFVYAGCVLHVLFGVVYEVTLVKFFE